MTSHNIFQIYVNRDSKIDHYGYDPIPEIERIRKEAPAMNDKEFHLSMSKMILKLRDFQ